MITLDEYIEQQQIPKIDFIKIDTEGYEMHVLKGAVETLKKFRPLLFVELSDDNLRQQNNTPQELVLFLNGLGYSAKNAETNEIISPQSNLHNCFMDILCSHSLSA